jgi:hypothetical protein
MPFDENVRLNACVKAASEFDCDILCHGYVGGIPESRRLGCPEWAADK